MTLTKKQEEALKIAVNRYKQRYKCTVIAGYAGVGKSTIVQFIIEALPGIDKDKDVVFATFTGKAAEVLRKKGNKNVSTLHKLLYESIPRPDGTFYRRPKYTLNYKVVVVDEISMVPITLMDLLFSHNCYVICLGDPAQLPSISKDDDNHLLDYPHVFLDEIIRQEQDSEIVRLSMKIRNDEKIDYYDGNEVKILSKKQLNTGMLLWADQILVATNKTRVQINKQMRKLLKKDSEMPMEGDKVICLRNYWDLLSENENDLINGTIGFLENKFDTWYQLPSWSTKRKVDVTMADFITDDDDKFSNLSMDTHMILTGEKCVDNRTAYKLGKNPKTRDLVPLEFTYGYAITTHKAQGSEWNNVLVIEENFPFDKEEHKRWLYTSVTRAKNRLVLIK